MDMTRFEVAAETVRLMLPGAKPILAVVLGSGWGDVAGRFKILHSLDYRAIPGYGLTQVQGHAGKLVLCAHDNREFLIFAGRRHYYEGVGLDPVALPVYLAKALGVSGMLLTNSAGGINPDLAPGALMLIEDHINAMGLNPLIGPVHPFWGSRFPDMSEVYDAGYRKILTEAAARAGLELRRGVYVAVTGPSYETPAEIRAFQRLGADAVGMSTVPEAILAHAAGLRVAAISCITNRAAGLSHRLCHDEVLVTAKAALPGMTGLIAEFISGVAP